MTPVMKHGLVQCDHAACGIADSGESRTGLPLEFQIQSANSGLFSCFALQWGFAPMSPPQQGVGQACFGVALWSNLPIVLPVKRLEVGTACLLLLPFAANAIRKGCPSGIGTWPAVFPCAHHTTSPKAVPALQLALACPLSALLKHCFLLIPISRLAVKVYSVNIHTTYKLAISASPGTTVCSTCAGTTVQLASWLVFLLACNFSRAATDTLLHRQ